VCLAPPAVGSDDRSAGPKVDLSFDARQALHPPDRQRPRGAERAHEPLDAVVARLESALDEVLMDPLRSEVLGELGQDDLAVRLTRARTADRSGWCRRRRSGR
jgi:hypothetical protein